jgi:hypothetical protein
VRQPTLQLGNLTTAAFVLGGLRLQMLRDNEELGHGLVHLGSQHCQPLGGA